MNGPSHHSPLPRPTLSHIPDGPLRWSASLVGRRDNLDRDEPASPTGTPGPGGDTVAYPQDRCAALEEPRDREVEQPCQRPIGG